MNKRPYLGWDEEQEIAQAKRVVESGENFPDKKISAAPNECDKCSNIQILEAFNKFRLEEVFYDAVILLGDGGIFHVHRIVLSSYSDYFRVLFTTILHTDELRMCTLPQMKSPIMKHLLDYMYLKRIHLNQYNIVDILDAADFLNMVEVLNLCCEFISENLSPENCYSVLKFVRNYKDKICLKLAETIYNYLMRHFIDVSIHSREILDMPVAELKLVLSAEELNVDNEEYVWECVLRWISHDLLNRKQYMATLLPHVRFGLMDPNFFLEQVRSHPWVKGKECRPYVLQTMKYLSRLNESYAVHAGEICRPRLTSDLLFAVGGWSGAKPTNTVEVYDCRLERWLNVAHVDPDGPRAYHGTAVLGYCIYVIGGFDGRAVYHSSCRCYDAVKKVWRAAAPMNCQRCYVGVATMGNSVFAMGGYNGVYRQNTAERYDPVENQWTLIAPMNLQRSDASAATLNGRIYIVGGFNGLECINSVEMYEPSLDQWTMIAPMINRRSGVGCVSHKGYLYALGGFNGVARLACVERYDPVLNAWTQVSNMMFPRSNFGYEVLDNMIFVVGGFNGVATFPDAECYDDNNNVWYRIMHMHSHRSALTACVLHELPNIEDYILNPDVRVNPNKNKSKVINFVDTAHRNVLDEQMETD